MNLVQSYLAPFQSKLNTVVADGSMTEKRMQSILAGTATIKKSEATVIADATDALVDPELLRELNRQDLQAAKAVPAPPKTKSGGDMQHSPAIPRGRFARIQRTD